jgi:hypothetical protein
MAKPRELYSGAAPQAMSLMGQGIADAYANVGRIEGQGMQAMGQGIAQGITSAASSVASYMKEAKQLEAQNKSYENFLGNKVGQTILGYTPEQSQQLIGEARKLTLDGGIRAGNDYLNLVVGGRLQQQNKLQLVKEEQKGLYDRAVAAKKPSLNMGSADKAIYDVLNPQDDGFGSPSRQSQPNAQDSTAGATGLAEFLRKRGWSGRGPVPQALMDEYNASIGR